MESLHLAIIPDGNRRWAWQNKLEAWKGHEESTENFRALTQWCRKDPRIGILTIWCFSTENWKRDAEEVRMLMRMLEKELTKERPSFHENKTRFRFSGRKDRLPASLLTLLEDITKETAEYTDFTTHLALDYGGQDELLRAMNTIPSGTEITDDIVRRHLDQPDMPDIDLVVRTSGEQRTSNFNLWQSTYAEWIFHPKLFPDFTIEDLAECVEEFAKRTRRFGA